MPGALPIIGAVIGIVGAVVSTKATVDAAKSTQQANQQQTNIAIAGNRLQSFNQNSGRSAERRKLLRNEQITRAQTISAGATAGAMGSSGVAGGIGSLSSEVGGALGVQQQQGNLSNLGSGINTAGAQRVNALNSKAQAAQSRAAIWGGVSSIGMTAFNVGGGFAGIKSFNEGRKAGS